MAVFPAASFAVTVKEKAEPAVAVEGTELRTSCDAAPGETVMEALLETADAEMVAPSVTEPARDPVNVAV